MGGQQYGTFTLQTGRMVKYSVATVQYNTMDAVAGVFKADTCDMNDQKR